MSYEKPEMQILILTTKDVITTSFNPEQGGEFGGEGDFSG